MSVIEMPACIKSPEILQAVAAPVVTPDYSAMRLLVLITFHFRTGTLQYLLSVLAAYLAYPVSAMRIVIVTNAGGEDLARIERALGPYHFAGKPEFEILVRHFDCLDDPWLLPWQHKPMILDFLESGYTHLIYTEDDVRLDFLNFQYFLKYLDLLKPLGLLPAFCVTECGPDGVVYAKEQLNHIDLAARKAVACNGYWFFNHDNPYQAFFILDQALAMEHVASPGFDVERSQQICPWWIAERAAMGLCFEKVPAGFSSRYVVPVIAETHIIPAFALVPHLPNKFVNIPELPLAKIPLDEMFGPP